MGTALGSIIAAIMTAQPARKARPSGIVTGMNMVIIMSGAPRLDLMTSAQATAATSKRAIEVMIVVRSRKDTRVLGGAGLERSAESMDAVYVGRRGKATGRNGERVRAGTARELHGRRRARLIRADCLPLHIWSMRSPR